jgi:hypothetical protein
VPAQLSLEQAQRPPHQNARRFRWRVAQFIVLALGLALILALIVTPRVGLIALWDVLIPAAPALLVFAPGLWRNICPLGTVSQLPRHLGIGRRFRTSRPFRNGTAIGSVVLLLILVPARHVGLDDSGVASAIALLLLGVMAAVAGFMFDGKSAWCAGLCPVHPVEQLYGVRPAATFINAHCTRCVRCTPICPDSTPSMSPMTSGLTRLQRICGVIILGGFPGFVWGWYHVPVELGPQTLQTWAAAYAWTWGSMCISLLLFLMLHPLASPTGRFRVQRLFAGIAVAIYYWYKLPALLGMSGGGAALLSLGDKLPGWPVWVCRFLTTTGLIAWLVASARGFAKRSWLHRPAYAVVAGSGSHAQAEPPRAATVVGG